MSDKIKLIDELLDNIKVLNSPIVVGLDPQISRIPISIKKRNLDKYGQTKKADLASIFDFNKDIIDSIQGVSCIVKPQIAYYEIYGYAGLEVFEKTIKYAKSKGFYIIADAKRGDIGSSSSAYANAFLGGGGFSSDFVTVNSYLGTDCLNEFVKVADENNKGIFVLVKTSNKSSCEIQDLKSDSDGIEIYKVVANIVESISASRIGKFGYSAIGAVVGATHPIELAEIRKIMPTSLFLVPGYGAQGGGAKDIEAAFDSKGMGAIINSSRGIIYAATPDDEDYKRLIRQAAIDMKNDIMKVVL